MLRDSLNRLAKDSSFCTWDWLECWWRHYGVGNSNQRQLFVLTVCNPSLRIIGIAPWYLENSLWLGRTIRFLGDGEGCSEYVSILAEPTNEDTVVAALFQWLT